MNKIDDFKSFVKKNPHFADYIRDNQMTWQKFYELYDMYGEDDTIWNNYRQPIKKSTATFNDFIDLAKKLDINKLEEGINSLSKVIGLFNDLIVNKKSTNSSAYKPRAIYRKFED